MAQYALPEANSGTTDWSGFNHDGDGDWYDELDEGFGAGRGSGSGPDALSTSWDSGTNPTAKGIRTDLAAVTDPATNTGHIYRTQSQKGGGAGGQQIDITIRLFQGATEKASATFTDIGTVMTIRTDTLSAAEADSITDYSNLEIDTEANKVGGGGPRRGMESAHEFECPDPPAGGGGFAHSQGVIVG